MSVLRHSLKTSVRDLSCRSFTSRPALYPSNTGVRGVFWRTSFDRSVPAWNIGVRGVVRRASSDRSAPASWPVASQSKTPGPLRAPLPGARPKPVPKPQSATILRSGASCLEPGQRLIIELKKPTDTRTDPACALYEYLDRGDVPWEHHTTFSSDVFTGVCVSLPASYNIEGLRKLQAVRSVGLSRLLQLSQPTNPRVLGGADNKLLGGKSVHALTGVDKLHHQGITGKGIKIAIIDSGVDYSHANLGGAFGAGNTVAGGYDFVGDAYTGNNQPVPGADPMDCSGHGTHVAGIIGAKGINAYGCLGVAKDAELYIYRILGCNGSVRDDVIMQALQRADDDQNDIITLCLGRASGWSTTESARLASRIARKGRVVTAAVGNDGTQGSWYPSSPGTGRSVISVASAENTTKIDNAMLVVGAAHPPIPYLAVADHIPVDIAGEWPIYAISTDTSVPDDACNPLPDSTPDLSGFITVVRRGTCDISRKLDHIAAKGGKVAIVYNNGGAFSPANFGDGAVKAVLIQDNDGAFLVDQFAKKTGVKVVFSIVQTPSPTGGLISTMSSSGPSYGIHFSPSIAAPGSDIMSTYPVKKGGFAVLSGTSMACAHMAGAAALILQAKGKSASVARSVRTLVQTTAKPVAVDNTDCAPLQTLIRQGAGLLNVHDAVHYKTVLTPGELLLGDTANWRARHSITIKNTGDTKTMYTITHVAAATVLTLGEGSPLPVLHPMPLTNDTVTARFSKRVVTIAPGQSAKIDVRFTPPSGVDAARLPVLSGFVEVSGGGETLRASYLGLAGSLKAATMLDPMPVLLNKYMKEQSGHARYTLVGSDRPTVQFRLAMGTQAVVMHLVSADSELPPTSTMARTKKGIMDKVKIIGLVALAGHIGRSPPNSDPFNFPMPRKFVGKGLVQQGDYRLLLRASKLTCRNLDDCEVYLSPAFSVIKP